MAVNTEQSSGNLESEPVNSWHDPSLVVLANKAIFFATLFVLLAIPLVSTDVRPVWAGVPFLLLYAYGWHTAKRGHLVRGAWG
ncbi:MAG: hypothetical protein ACPGTU_14095, partial [Myxococcota bacterium]